MSSTEPVSYTHLDVYKRQVHVMFRAQPKTELSKFINAYKSASSRLLKKEYPEIGENFGKKHSGVRVSAF